MFRGLVIVALVVSCTCTSWAQTAPAEAVARSFMERLGRSTTFAAIDEKPQFEVVDLRNDDGEVRVDAIRLKVISWSDFREPCGVQSWDGTAPVVRNVDEAWTAAERWAVGAGIPLLPRDEASEHIDEGVVFGYALAFRPRPSGYRSAYGNQVTFIVSAFTGKIVTMSRMIGFAYDAPRVVLSESEAVSAFRQRARLFLGYDLNEAHSRELAFTVSDAQEGFGDPNRPPLFRTRRLDKIQRPDQIAPRYSRNDARVAFYTGYVLFLAFVMAELEDWAENE